MFHLSMLGLVPRRSQFLGLLLALLLAGSTFLAFTTTGVAHASAGSAVTYANSHWNWSYYDPQNHTLVPKGAGQHNFQCAEFVARALSTLGIIYGPHGNLGPNSPQSSYLSDKIGSKTWDFLWVGYAPPYNGLKQYLLANGLVKDIGNHIAQASPGDIVIYPGSDGLGHTALLVKIDGKNSLVDQHNVAYKDINYQEYASIDILHIW